MYLDERYKNDAQFKRLVDSLFFLIKQADFTPTEIRGAAMLAQIRYEQINPRPFMPSLEQTESIESFRKRYP